MFQLIETLYGLTIEPSVASTWHPDVRFYSIRDRAGNLVGQFYLDMYARLQSEVARGWTMPLRVAGLPTGIQTPVAYLNCNFAAPVGESNGKEAPCTLHA
jgi:oligopeptidase A